MKILTRITVVAVAAILLVAVAPPAQAACGGFAQIATNDGAGSRSFLWTADVFDGPPNYNIYFYLNYAPYSYATPISSNFRGSFWRLTSGDIGLGAGDDNGAFDWINDAVNGGVYYYSAAINYGAQIFTGWGADAGIDGCIEPAGSCTCVLLTDSVNGEGRFAIIAAAADASFSSLLNQPGADPAGNPGGPIILQPFPAPVIDNSVKNGGGVDFSVTAALPASGFYQKDGCDCGPIGYKVVAQQLAQGSMPPTSRDEADWPDADPAVTPMDQQANFFYDCDQFADAEAYLATSLVFDSNFEVQSVSANTSRIACGVASTLADPGGKPRDVKPVRPDRRLDRGDRDR